MTRLLPLLALTVATDSAAELPRRIELTYEVSWNGMGVGTSIEKFEHDDRQFKIVSDTRTTGLAAMLRKINIHVESNGLMVKGLPRPSNYAEERTRKPRRSATFDWTKNQVTLDSGSGAKVVALPDYPVYDRATFPWSFVFLPPVRDGKLGITDGRKLTEYRYAVAGKTQISTPAGEFEALHLKKIQDAGDERGFEMWLAIQKHYLPVRIIFKDDDNTVDSIVSSIAFPTKP